LLVPNATTDKLAVLIDADNAQSSVAQELFAEVAGYGTATVRRAYGDWTTRKPPRGSAPPLLPSATEGLQPVLLQAISAAGRDDGWAALSAVGSFVTKANPSFDSRNYGFQKLSELVKAQPYLELKAVPTTDGSPIVHLFVRRREP
jgi:hypothetical protein